MAGMNPPATVILETFMKSLLFIAGPFSIKGFGYGVLYVQDSHNPFTEEPVHVGQNHPSLGPVER
jgi:hypothetical protein